MATITKSPLPTVTSSDIRQLGWRMDSDHYRAYVCILQAERGTTDADDLVSVRVAGYMLIEFAKHSSVLGSHCGAKLANRIISPSQSFESEQQNVIDVSTHLRDKLIRMFRTTNTVYSQPSSHPSRASFDTLEDTIKDSIESTSDTPGASRRKTLVRDGFRCVITGIYDKASVEKHPEIRGLKKIPALVLEVAHIFNPSAMQNIDPEVSDDDPGKLLDKTRTSAAALTTLNMFGFSNLTDIFMQSGGVHNVWNLLTLERNLHSDFDRLDLWFEYTEKPHRYKVCTFYPFPETIINSLFRGHDRAVDGAPGFVEFNSQYREVPPPEPLLLTLHAACARVVHMSGAAEFFDRIERDVEETKVLARDGSSAPLLANILSCFVDPSVPSHIVIPGVA